MIACSGIHCGMRLGLAARLYGGIHIQDGDLRGQEMGQSVASLVIERTQELF